jgi:hypothetical protein
MVASTRHDREAKRFWPYVKKVILPLTAERYKVQASSDIAMTQ